MAGRRYLGSRLPWHSSGTISTSTTLSADDKWHNYPTHNTTLPWQTLPLHSYPSACFTGRTHQTLHSPRSLKQEKKRVKPWNNIKNKHYRTSNKAQQGLRCFYLRSWVATFSFVTSTSWISLNSKDRRSSQSPSLISSSNDAWKNEEETFGTRWFVWKKHNCS